MKLNASAQNVFAFSSALPNAGQWERGTAGRARFKLKPFAIEQPSRTAAQDDTLARKQEIVCAVILTLCLLFTFAVCFGQLAHL